MTTTTKQHRDELLEKIVDRIEHFDRHRGHDHSLHGLGAQLCDFRNVMPGEVREYCGLEADQWRELDGAGVDVIDGDLDMGIMLQHDEDLSLCRSKRIAASQARGKITEAARYIIRTTTMIVRPKGQPSDAVSFYVAAQADGAFRSITRSPIFGGVLERGGSFMEWIQKDIRIAITVQLAMEYTWGVEFVTKSGAGFVLPCSSDGIRQILRDRDRPAGAKRRQSLRTWVAEHARATRTGDRAMVREHLRGSRQCQWNDMRCRILVPLAEIRAVEASDRGPAKSVVEEGEVRRAHAGEG